MRKFLIVGGLALAGCTLNGPGADGAGAASGLLDPEGAVASKSEALSWISGPYIWNQGDSVLPMQLVSTSICVLTRVQGRLGGGGESVSVTEDGNFWYLGGSSQQSGVGGTAYCYARSLVVPTTGGGTSGEFMIEEPGNDHNRCFGTSGTTWWGDAATMISGIKGRMDGGCESVSITQSASAFAPSQFSAGSGAPAAMWGFAHAFYFGPASSGRPITFVGPTGTQGKVGQIVEQSASGNGGFVVLAPSGQSLCYFTKISGGFFGGGEWAEMSRSRIGSTDYWVLRTSQGTSSANVSASARCISRNQQ